MASQQMMRDNRSQFDYNSTLDQLNKLPAVVNTEPEYRNDLMQQPKQENSGDMLDMNNGGSPSIHYQNQTPGSPKTMSPPSFQNAMQPKPVEMQQPQSFSGYPGMDYNAKKNPTDEKIKKILSYFPGEESQQSTDMYQPVATQSQPQVQQQVQPQVQSQVISNFDSRPQSSLPEQQYYNFPQVQSQSQPQTQPIQQIPQQTSSYAPQVQRVQTLEQKNVGIQQSQQLAYQQELAQRSQAQQMQAQVQAYFDRILQFMSSVDQRLNALEETTREVLRAQREVGHTVSTPSNSTNIDYPISISKQELETAKRVTAPRQEQYETDMDVARRLQAEMDSEYVMEEELAKKKKEPTKKPSDKKISFKETTTDCPICSKPFPMSEIEAHVNECFEASIKNENPASVQKKTEEKQGFLSKLFSSNKKPDQSATTPLLDLNKQPPQNSSPKPQSSSTGKVDSTNPALYPTYAYNQPPYYGAPVYPQTATQPQKGYPGTTSQTAPTQPQPQFMMMNPQTGQYSVVPNNGMPQPFYYYPQMPQYPQQPQTQPKKP